ncbi:MAG TPA: hypothetical protein VF870_13405, partial [Ignavibacteriaceae bacterium]
MKRIALILICLSLTLNLYAQDNIGEKTKKNINDAVYYQEFLNAGSDKPGLSRVDVFIQVPYKNVNFIKSNQGFTSKYSMTVSVFDSLKKQLIVEKTWNETIDVIDFTMTTSKDNYKLSRKSFDVAPGTYTIRTMLQDKDSKQEAVGENLFVVRDYNKEISLSDILMISKYDSLQGRNEIIPNISRNIPTSKDRVKFYFEVYSKDSTDVDKTFEYTVFNSEKNVIHKEVEDRNI